MKFVTHPKYLKLKEENTLSLDYELNKFMKKNPEFFKEDNYKNKDNF